MKVKQRAEEIVQSWPEWKRNLRLTKYSPERSRQMKVKPESTCKTREEAKAGKRDKPHLFLDNNRNRFVCVAPPGSGNYLGLLYLFPEWANRWRFEVVFSESRMRPYDRSASFSHSLSLW